MQGMIRRILFALVILGGGVSIAIAQNPIAPMDGNWFNVDTHTGGIVRLVMKGRTIHEYGRCAGKVCDLGTVKGKLSDDAMRFTGKRSDAMGPTLIEISMDENGALTMRTKTHYYDHRFGPDDNVVTVTLRKQAQP